MPMNVVKLDQWTSGEKAKLRDILRLLESFRALDAEFPLQQAITLLQIALNEGMSQTEIMARIGLSTSGLSRNVASLGDYHRGGQPGYNFIEAKTDPTERRRKPLTITGKGRSFLRSLMS